MMKTALLCGHTGSKNRGCEALVLSTQYVLDNAGYELIKALTYDKDYDCKLGLDQQIALIEYPHRTLFQRAIGKLTRVLFKNYIYSGKPYYRSMLENIERNTHLYSIGGDTYCYDIPYTSYALNVLAEQNEMSNIWWGCSIDERCLYDKQMQEDINRYAAIVVRETLSYEIIQKIIKDKDKVFLACDPAFHLPMKKTMLPKRFLIKNTLGINLSDLVIRFRNDRNDILYKNIRNLIDFVLKATDMTICLIPHVYSAEERSADLSVLDVVKSFYPNEQRVMVIDQELSCTELKYIISNCRFFIGARTHATIAAYSTAVPAIALSYSIKSRGIARDIFGTEEGYVIPWKQIGSENMVKDIFVQVLYNNEQRIREHYKGVLPKYKESILEVAIELKRRLL